MEAISGEKIQNTSPARKAAIAERGRRFVGLARREIGGRRRLDLNVGRRRRPGRR
jgi:hypothetical protein